MNMVILIVVGLILSVVVAYLGKNRKFGFWGYFFASLLLTPLVGLLLVLASDPPTPRESRSKEKTS